MPTEFCLLEMVDLDLDRSGTAKLDEALDVCSAAERIGFSRLWFGEHHGPASPSPNAMLSAALIARETSTIRLGTAASLQRTRAPGLIVEDACVLAHVLGGRFDLGIGRGAVGVDVAREISLVEISDDDELTAAVETTVDAVVSAFTSADHASLPEVWLHGTGHRSAAAAARLETNYCHALFLNGDLAACERAVAHARTGGAAVGVGLNIAIGSRTSTLLLDSGLAVNIHGSVETVADGIELVIKRVRPEVVVLAAAHRSTEARVEVLTDLLDALRSRGV